MPLATSGKKKEKGLGKVSRVTGGNGLLKSKHVFIESQVKDNLHYQLLILLTSGVYLNIYRKRPVTSQYTLHIK